MAIFALITMFFAVYADARILRRVNGELYQKILKFKEWQWGLMVIALAFSFLPIYLLRRRKFKLASSQADIEDIDTQIDETERKKHFLASDALGVFLIWIFGMMVWLFILLGLMTFLPKLITEMGEMLVTSVLSSVLMIVLIYKTIEKYPKSEFKEFLALSKEGHSMWKIFFVPIGVGGLFAYVSTMIIMNRAIQPVTPLSEVMDTAASSFLMVAFFAVAVILAPFLEEVIFRGYFYRVVSQVKGPLVAVIFISLLFAFLHVGQYWGDWMAIVMVSLVGLALTLLRYWSGSTISSVVAHYTYNIGLTVISIVALLISNPSYLEFSMKYDSLSMFEKEGLLLKSINKEPDFAPAYNDLAWLYAQEDMNLGEALTLIDKALVVEPENEAYLDTKAEVLYKIGRIDEAIVIAQGLVKKGPSYEYYRKQLDKFKEALEEEKRSRLWKK